jgi:hypothetical protein
MGASDPEAGGQLPAMPPSAGKGGSMVSDAGAASFAPNPATCPPAPAGAPEQALAALAAINNYRVPAGAGCATMVPAINASASAHCAYFAMHTPDDGCLENPHLEVAGCAGFTGMTPDDRMKASGYAEPAAGEVMAFLNDAEASVDTWINSVWPRVTILDPWKTHIGYGSAMRCDTIDFGRGTPAPETTIVVYPYDGQTNVPLAFAGPNKGPTLPAPETGWPSSVPISIFAQKVAVTEHVLTKDGDTTPLDHVWLDTHTETVAAEMRQSLSNVVFLYANVPFEANTRYRVKVSGTYAGGLLQKQWTFTTGSPPAMHGRHQ